VVKYAARNMRELLKLLLILAAVGVGIWLYLKLLALCDAHGVSLGRYDPRTKPPKVEIQSLFHGNTKDDEDQI
jgi:hypothetical protein